MTLSAWRPLKDAPRDKDVVTASYGGLRVIVWDEGRGWGYQASWGWRSVDVETTEYVPIADTLELDRAVQFAVAIAFGQLIDALVMARALRNIGNDGWADIQQSEVVQALKRLHVSMGGRIPDEVP